MSTIQKDEITLLELILIYKKHYKLMLLVIIIVLFCGASYHKYVPKKYESVSLLSVGKIHNLPIESIKSVKWSLHLISFPEYPSSNFSEIIDIIDDYNLKITTTSLSPERAYEFNNAMIDTILNRHNKQIKLASIPIEKAINNIAKQIDLIENNIQNHKFSELNLPSLAMMNESRLALEYQLNNLILSKVIIPPNIPVDYSWPKSLMVTLNLSLALGLILSILIVHIKDFIKKSA